MYSLCSSSTTPFLKNTLSSMNNKINHFSILARIFEASLNKHFLENLSELKNILTIIYVSLKLSFDFIPAYIFKKLPPSIQSNFLFFTLLIFLLM